MSMICCLVAVHPDELNELIQDPSNILDVVFPDDVGKPVREESFDLDKMWHGLHYLLTGIAWGGDPPLSLAILGGTEIGEDTGYGPPRYLVPDEVRQVAAALYGTPHDVFMARFAPTTMNQAEIYSGKWEECEATYFRQHLTGLTAFYRNAAAMGQAVLICIS